MVVIFACGIFHLTKHFLWLQVRSISNGRCFVIFMLRSALTRIPLDLLASMNKVVVVLHYFSMTGS